MAYGRRRRAAPRSYTRTTSRSSIRNPQTRRQGRQTGDTSSQQADHNDYQAAMAAIDTEVDEAKDHAHLQSILAKRMPHMMLAFSGQELQPGLDGIRQIEQFYRQDLLANNTVYDRDVIFHHSVFVACYMAKEFIDLHACYWRSNSEPHTELVLPDGQQCHIFNYCLRFFLEPLEVSLETLYTRLKECCQQAQQVLVQQSSTPQPTSIAQPMISPAQRQRKHSSMQLVRDRGLPVMEDLPVLPDADHIDLQTQEAISKRIIGLTVCALRGETKAKDPAVVTHLIKVWGCASYFTPKERQFLTTGKPDEQDLVNFCWQYECVHVLLWALQIRMSIHDPDVVCNVKDDVGMVQRYGPLGLTDHGQLRSKDEILDMCDYYYRLNWAATHLQIQGQRLSRLDAGIVHERHKALNWLIQLGSPQWDEVRTDT